MRVVELGNHHSVLSYYCEMKKNLANVMALKLGEYNNMRKNIEKKVQFQALQK